MMSAPALTSSPYQLAETGSVKINHRERRNLIIIVKRLDGMALKQAKTGEPFHLS